MNCLRSRCPYSCSFSDSTIEFPCFLFSLNTFITSSYETTICFNTFVSNAACSFFTSKDFINGGTDGLWVEEVVEGVGFFHPVLALHELYESGGVLDETVEHFDQRRGRKLLLWRKPPRAQLLLIVVCGNLHRDR
eukprot:TRINITY_DN6006_c0_g1_i19.p1 TRINITY_DN6006_c0_g1~~TRINITY_DN6006_c0_g1_i19.p1  ORF type:complete len:135 (+),score=11.18 TRINITY_DN6006_c0_g1_i19:311-715(+)